MHVGLLAGHARWWTQKACRGHHRSPKPSGQAGQGAGAVLAALQEAEAHRQTPNRGRALDDSLHRLRGASPSVFRDQWLFRGPCHGHLLRPRGSGSYRPLPDAPAGVPSGAHREPDGPMPTPPTPPGRPRRCQTGAPPEASADCMGRMHMPVCRPEITADVQLGCPGPSPHAAASKPAQPSHSCWMYSSNMHLAQKQDSTPTSTAPRIPAKNAESTRELRRPALDTLI